MAISGQRISWLGLSSLCPEDNPVSNLHLGTHFNKNITVTSWWVQWHLKSPALWLLAQPFTQAQIKENIKAPHHWPLCREFTGDQWIPHTKGQYRGRCFHLMTSSWNHSYSMEDAAAWATPWATPDSKVHGANMGPIWGRLDPGGPHVGPMNLAFWDTMNSLSDWTV